MRSGSGRGVRFSLMALAGLALATPARAGEILDWFHHYTIPRTTLAKDYRTGDVMMAPPIPYGEYAKDYVGAVHGAIGHVKGLCGRCGGALCGQCGGLGNKFGRGCGSCGGSGCGGACGQPTALSGAHHELHSAFGNGFGVGPGQGPGSLCDTGPGGPGMVACGHGKGGPCRGKGCKLGAGLGHGGGYSAGFACVGKDCGTASAQGTAVPVASGQVSASGQSARCGGCGGRGCGLCGGSGLFKKHHGNGGLCAGPGCGDPSHGHGGGLFNHGGGGLFNHGGRGSLCGSCGGKGCQSCGGGGKCGFCHGKGCRFCGGGHLMGLASKVLHIGDVKYFVGPGGPVPLTPGYVPYVVTTRSPRDFFAFPPFTENAP